MRSDYTLLASSRYVYQRWYLQYYVVVARGLTLPTLPATPTIHYSPPTITNLCQMALIPHKEQLIADGISGEVTHSIAPLPLLLSCSFTLLL